MMIILMLITMIMPMTADALCLQNCQKPNAVPTFNSVGGYQRNAVRSRERSHNTGDVKNSVMGDVNIKVGHEKLDIKMSSGAKNNTVDASVNSTIILGDMSK